MIRFLILILAFAPLTVQADETRKLGVGDHDCQLKHEGLDRHYYVHVPKSYDSSKASPIVLMFHGAGVDARRMVRFTGMNQKADEAGFIAVYPDGTGIGSMKTWNAGGFDKKLYKNPPNDVGFIRTMLDELGKQFHVDPKRIYATGMSNGGMMCYRVAAELSDRIAAIAPVAGTMTDAEPPHPKRAVPVMHFHGTKDTLVPYQGPGKGTPKFLTFRSVEDTIKAWSMVNGCEIEKPIEETLPDKAKDQTQVKRQIRRDDKTGNEVVLFVIEGGGHTWPGRPIGNTFLGKSTLDISANDLMWDFFVKHPMKS